MMEQTETKNRLSPWVFVIAIGNVGFHLAFYNTLGFHRDELLYFSLGQHLSVGYASVPPFTGFIAWLMIHVLGYSLLAARIIPMLLSGVLILLGASITRELQGKSYAQIITAIALLVVPFNFRAFTMLQPVCFDILAWSLVFWLALKWINTKADKYLLFLGLAAGIGMLNKYLIALQIAGLLIAFLLSSYRSFYKKKAFYFAILIALLVFLPNLVWQIAHHLPVLVHMQALNDSQLVHVNRFEFLSDQVAMSAVAVILNIPGLLFLCFGKRLHIYRPLAITGLIVLIALVILRGKSYYSLGLFPLWIAAGGVYWESVIKTATGKILLPAMMILFTIPVLPMGMPIFNAEKLVKYFAYVKSNIGFDMPLRWEDGRIHSLPLDYADMLGWEELAAITSMAYEQAGDKPSTMIYAENYGEAGAVMVIGKKYHLPEPVSFSESFFYWVPRSLNHEIKTLIYINDRLGDDVKALFADCRLIGKITNPLSREYGTGVWLCKQPRQSFNELWKKRILQVTDPFHH